MLTDHHHWDAPDGAEGDRIQIAAALGAIARRVVPSVTPQTSEERELVRKPAISRHDTATMVNMAL